MFTVAYKAMIFQLESGEELLIEPPPETLLPKPEKREPTEDEIKKGSEAISNLLNMFDTKEPAPLTPAEIASPCTQPETFSNSHLWSCFGSYKNQDSFVSGGINIY